MADTSLDDFFAKKDKSKKKNKSKSFTPINILAQQEPPQPKPEKKKKEKEKAQTPEDTENSVQPKDEEVKEVQEEWNEFVPEEEADYSGLRIQNIQISTQQEEPKADDPEEDDEDEDGEPRERKEKAADGPWAGGAAPPPKPKPEPEPEVIPEPPKEEPEPVKSGKYVPPSMRGLGSSALEPTRLTSQRYGRKKAAPNIQSEEDFPTLGGPAPQANTWTQQKFEKVRSGGRQREDPSNRGPQLTLGNKFDALQKE